LVPSQLLPVPPNFINRDTELAALLSLLGGTEPRRPVTLSVIVGVGGAGKTSLALRWLHDLVGRFPAGQLYADLRGHHPDTTVGPGEILGRFLRSLGVAPERIPLELDEAAALWRSVTAGRPMIMLLDNAASAAQVRALLPGPGPSLVAVTTRWRLGGLAIDGAHFTELGPLVERDAIELLARVMGTTRASAEPEAARAVVRMCGQLPLAVCISAARLAANPRWRVERVAAELASERDRLTALTLTEDLSVRATFDMSYQALPPEAPQAYRSLSLVPGPDFSRDLAAAALAATPGETAQVLDQLTGASLLEEMAEGRFRYHDLVRLHAREHADADPESERGFVVARAVDWYLESAVAADLVIIPGRWQLSGLFSQARQRPPAFPSPAEALAWLEAELPGLLAAVQAAHDAGLHEHVWQLCEALWGLFLYRRHFRHWIAAHETGIASAQACGDLRAQARMRDQLGFAYLTLRRYDVAEEQFTQAVSLAQQAGHRLGEAAPLEHVGLTLLATHRPDEALPYFIQAQSTYEELGRRRGVALMTRRIGEAHRDSGRYQESIATLDQARREFAALPDAYNEARATTDLAEAHIQAGQSADAVALLTEALATITRLGARDKQAGIHVLLADAAERQDDAARARDHLAQALVIYTELGAPEAAQVSERLATSPASADAPEAVNEQDSTDP
jgi:tetratricopeptide (TPR) repeat protein